MDDRRHGSAWAAEVTVTASAWVVARPSAELRKNDDPEGFSAPPGTSEFHSVVYAKFAGGGTAAPFVTRAPGQCLRSTSAISTRSTPSCRTSTAAWPSLWATPAAATARHGRLRRACRSRISRSIRRSQGITGRNRPERRLSRRPVGSTGFLVQPRRWVVERVRGMPRTGWLG
jgi:hypothetical protein